MLNRYWWFRNYLQLIKADIGNTKCLLIRTNVDNFNFLTNFYLLVHLYNPIYIVIYRVVGNWWYKRKGGDSTRKKKSKVQNKNFSFEALFSRKSTLNFRSVRVHFILAFHTLKQSNTLKSVHRNLIRRAEVCVRQNVQHFQQFL